MFRIKWANLRADKFFNRIRVSETRGDWSVVGDAPIKGDGREKWKRAGRRKRLLTP